MHTPCEDRPFGLCVDLKIEYRYIQHQSPIYVITYDYILVGNPLNLYCAYGTEYPYSSTRSCEVLAVNAKPCRITVSLSLSRLNLRMYVHVCTYIHTYNTAQDQKSTRVAQK